MSLTTEDTTIARPDDLPTDPAEFWGKPPTNLVTTPHTVGTELPVIDQLGSAPFKKEKGGFPFLGFLASVYEHVSTTALTELHAPPAKPVAAAPTAESEEESDIDVEEPVDVQDDASPQ